MSENQKALAGKKPRRTRRWAKVTGLVILCLVLAGFLASGGLMLWGSRRIKREIQSIKALNEPTNWDELMRTDRQGHVVASGNAAVQGRAAALYSRALEMCSGWSKAVPKSIQKKLGKEVLSPEEVDRLGEALSSYQEALEYLREAVEQDGKVDLPGLSIAFDEKQADELASMREAGRLLGAQARYLAMRGRGDEAADTCVALLRYARAFTGSNLLGGLVQLAVTATACHTTEQVLASAPCSAETLEVLQKEFEESVDDTPLVRILCGERVCGNQLLQSEIGLPRFSLWPNHAAYLEVMHEAIRVSREPFPDSLRAMERLRPRYPEPKGLRFILTVFANLTVPQLNRSFVEAATIQTRVRTTLACVAVRRVMQDGMPMPAALEQIVPKYLPAVPTDPFTGEPLRYKVDESGCVIYSVGEDCVDDGGDVNVNAEGGGRHERDIGVFLAR